MTSLDLNADIGEGYHDAPLLPLLSSANICCGRHAGNLQLTASTMAAAHRHQLAIGCHPGYPDRASMGRVELHQSESQLLAELLNQMNSFAEIAAELQLPVSHLKPHGALYHRLNWQPSLANKLCQLMLDHFPQWRLYAQANSPLYHSAHTHSLTVISEGFADRRYHADGRLQSRQQAGSCLEQPPQVLQQLRQLLNGEVDSVDGTPCPIQIDSLCVHGDNPHALAITRSIHQQLTKLRLVVRAPK